MSAERHQQISDLFWEVCDLPPDEQLGALNARTTDPDLIAQVTSLLQEHNTQAAEREGENVIPPPDAMSLVGDVSDLVQPGNPPEEDSDLRTTRLVSNLSSDRSSATMVSSERTHAMPRFALETPGEDEEAESLDRMRADMQAHMGSNARGSLASLSWRSVVPWVVVFIAFTLPAWWLAIHWKRQQLAQRRLNDVAVVTATRNTLGARIEQSIESHRALSATVSQDKETRAAILRLLKLSDEERRDDIAEAVRLRDQIRASIRNSLNMVAAPLRSRLNKRIAGSDWQPRYVVWDRTMKIVASWQDDLGDVNSRVHPDGAANLARVLAEQSVLFGPAILNDPVPGFQPETDQPVMGWIVPVYLDSESGEHADALPSAAMLIRGLGLFDELDNTIRIAALERNIDAYLVDSRGTLLTNSPALYLRRTMAANQEDAPAQSMGIACQYLVAEPIRNAITQLASRSKADLADADAWSDILRMQSNRLTYSAAACSRGQTGIRSDPYLNYLGDMCVGAWIKLPVLGGGLIVERSQTLPTGPPSVTWPWALGWTLWVLAGLWLLRLTRRRQPEPATLPVQPLQRYEVLEEIGSGGMGLVYRAKHRELGREVALKLLRSDRENPDDHQRFDREARLASILQNPHSVGIHDYGRDEHGRAFCVMQLLQGLTLYEVVTRGGCQEVGRVVWILRQICRSIAEAHQRGLMHRDLKPQNVMLQWDELVGDWAVVFDFGLAKPLEPSADMFQTAEKIWAGTPMYMAPERFRQPTLMDPRSDIYSIGGIAYFLLAGRPPFAECDPESMFALILSDDPTEIRTHRGEPIDSRLDHLVTRCLSKSASDRYESVGEITMELEALAQVYPWGQQQAGDWWKRHAPERMADDIASN